MFVGERANGASLGVGEAEDVSHTLKKRARAALGIMYNIRVKYGMAYNDRYLSSYVLLGGGIKFSHCGVMIKFKLCYCELFALWSLVWRI